MERVSFCVFLVAILCTPFCRAHLYEGGRAALGGCFCRDQDGEDFIEKERLPPLQISLSWAHEIEPEKRAAVSVEDSRKLPFNLDQISKSLQPQNDDF